MNYKADHRFADLMQCIVLCCIKLYCIVQDEGKEEVNYKADHRFADLMQDKTEAVSDFAKKRSMSQQRQYLPIFAVRNEVG